MVIIETPDGDEVGMRLEQTTASRFLPVVSGDFAVAAETGGILGRLIARRLGLGKAEGAPVAGRLDVTARPSTNRRRMCERWTRTFGTRTWTSTLAPGADGVLVERAGPLRLDFHVDVDENLATRMVVRRIRVGAIPTPLARWVCIAGIIEADRTTVVTVRVPGGHCTYRATPESIGITGWSDMHDHIELAVGA